MSKKVTVAAIQLAPGPDPQLNLEKAIDAVIDAAQLGANIVLLPELFTLPYFCKRQDASYQRYAQPLSSCQEILALSLVAKEFSVVLPVSFYQQIHNAFFNALVVIDANGQIGDVYHKSHIPDGSGYQEKFYFQPGATGFKVWHTQYASIGCGICWDQWFPEAARVMSLAGAELLLYPTAIGSEPLAPELDTKAHWQLTMQGHAAANMVPVIASNRVGQETDNSVTIDFYGSSFITDQFGAIQAQASRDNPETLLHTFDLQTTACDRQSWGIYRDRRPELYGPITQTPLIASQEMCSPHFE